MVCVNKFVNNGPFAAERSFGTNCQTGEQMMLWDMLDYIKPPNLNFLCLTCPVRHLLASLVILYHVTAQLQRTHYYFLAHFCYHFCKKNIKTIIVIITIIESNKLNGSQSQWPAHLQQQIN